MRIASYNIMSGGFNNYTYDVAKPERWDLLGKAVKEINADLIGLIDTFRWDEIFTVEELQNSFDYPYVCSINLNDKRLRKLGHNNGITIFSRIPVKQFQTVSLGTRDCLKAEIIYNGKQVAIYGTYLDDISEDARFAQAKSLLDSIKKDVPTIVMGDLNTFNRLEADEIRPRLEEFYLKNPTVLDYYKPNLEDMMKGDVITVLTNAGFIDTAMRGSPTMPTKLGKVNSDKPYWRLDYILHTPDINVEDYKVWREDIFDRTSDHYPISCEISL